MDGVESLWNKSGKNANILKITMDFAAIGKFYPLSMACCYAERFVQQQCTIQDRFSSYLRLTGCLRQTRILLMLIQASLGSPTQWFILAVIVLIVFGAKRLPEIARSLGKSLGILHKAKREFEEELLRAQQPESAAKDTSPELEAKETNPAPKDNDGGA